MRHRILGILVFAVMVLSSCTPGLFDFPETPTPLPPEPTADIPIPDPLRIVYISTDRSIWMYQEGIGSLKLLDAAVQTAFGVQISDDGRYISFVNQLGELWAIDLDNLEAESGIYPLISAAYLQGINGNQQPVASIHDFEFIPSTHELLVTIRVSEDAGGMDLFHIDAENDDSVPARLLPPGQAGEIHYSPDGEWFVLTLPHEIVLSPRNFLDSVQIFDDYPPYLALGARGGPDIVWAGDSQSFFVAAPIYEEGELMGETRVWRVSIPDGELGEQFDYLAQIYHRAYVSPLGRRVVFETEYGDVIDLSIASDDGQQVFITYPKTLAGFIGWLPVPDGSDQDSSCFVYWQDNRQFPSWACDGSLRGTVVVDSVIDLRLFRIVDPNHLLYVNGISQLVYQEIDGPVLRFDSMLSQTGLPCFDIDR